MNRFTRRAALGATAITLATPRIAMSQTNALKVMVFPGVGNLPLFVGQAQIMTPAGVLPLSFEIPAMNLAEACAGFADGAKVAVEETMRELQEMRRQQASSIVIPEAGAAAALGQGGPPRGKIQFP